MPKGYPNSGKQTSNKGWFKKGVPGYFKGKKRPPSTGAKISASKMGHPVSEETRRKISEANKGKKAWNSGMKGNYPKKYYEKLCGANNKGWKGGVTPLYKKIRKSPEYKSWRVAVFKRDNYTCIFCGVRGGELNADHIKPFSIYPDLRFSIDNGRTLCVPCHRKTETWGARTDLLQSSPQKLTL